MCRPSHAWLKCGSKAAWDSRGAWDMREGEQRTSWCHQPSAVKTSDSVLMQTFHLHLQGLSCCAQALASTKSVSGVSHCAAHTCFLCIICAV